MRNIVFKNFFLEEGNRDEIELEIIEHGEKELNKNKK